MNEYKKSRRPQARACSPLIFLAKGQKPPAPQGETGVGTSSSLSLAQAPKSAAGQDTREARR